MQHIWSLENVSLQNAWLTIGSFDGVHRGHQEIVRNMVAGAHSVGSPAVVLTFHPHPAVVLGKRNGSIYLTTPEDRADLLGELGVDVVITHPFNRQVANMTAEEFMMVVSNHLGLKHLWVGYDFALGHGREGTVPVLRLLGEKMGFEVNVLSPLKIDGQVVSSSLVRSQIASGEVEQAARSLGRPYRVRGMVEPGDGRGRTIGIPTANLAVWEGLVLPRVGVYACHAQVASLDNQMWGAVTNVGMRPTFHQDALKPQVEAHLLGFQGDLYGKQIALDFLARLRDEQRFPNVETLVAQINSDIERAKKLFDPV